MTGPNRAVAAASASPAARVSVEMRPPAPVRVYMNGRRLGTTPIRRVAVRPGRYVFEAIRPDGVRMKRVVRFHPAEDASLVLVQ